MFAQNLLELSAAVISATPAAGAVKPIARLYDRDRALQYAAMETWLLNDIAPLTVAQGPSGQVDIDIDLGSAQAVAGWALVNHNITGVTVTLFGDNSSPASTSRDTVAPALADTLRTFGTLTLRYWRVRIPAMAVAPMLGELLLGTPRVITQNPALRQSGTSTLGNVTRDYSPAKISTSTRKGSPRSRLPYGWTGLPDADLTTLRTAYTECRQGADKLLVQDVLGILRWMDWISASLEPVPIGNGLSEISIELEEAL